MENLNIDNVIDANKNDIILKSEKIENDEIIHEVLTVMFEVTKKRYYFEVLNDLKFVKGEKLIVETIRGKEIGIACGPATKIKDKELTAPLKPVIKKASEEEIKNYEELRNESRKANDLCKERIRKHKLEMKLVETEFTYDRSKLIFYFTAEGRIDFRELVKDLAGVFRTRIELRQIGVRDEARILGRIGVCGKELCCRTFINKFNSVSIKMARDQGLVINPTKISGVCGRLLCCISYEYMQYEEALRKCPAVNQTVLTNEGNGRVVSINPLNEFLYVDVPNNGIMRYNLEDVKFDKKEASKLKSLRTSDEKRHKGLEKE